MSISDDPREEFDEELNKLWKRIEGDDVPQRLDSLSLFPSDNAMDAYVEYREDLRKGINLSSKLSLIEEEVSIQSDLPKENLSSHLPGYIPEDQEIGPNPKEEPKDSFAQVFLEARDYRSAALKKMQDGAEQADFLQFTAGSVMRDAWERRWFNLEKYSSKHSRAAVSLLGNSIFSQMLKVVIFIHMSMIFFEPASTWSPPDESCGETWGDFTVQLSIEYFILSTYFCALLLMIVSHISSFTTSLMKGRTRERKSFKLYPLVFCGIITIMFADLALRSVLWYGSDTGIGAVYAFSRCLRPLLLLVVTRPLRQLSSTILRVLPNILWLLAFGFTVLLGFAVIGVQLLSGVYEDSAFDSWYRSAVALFVLFTGENYPFIVTPAFEESGWFFLFFLLYILVGGVFFVAMLGLVYDSYRRNVLRNAFRNFNKERMALTTVFGLLSEDGLYITLYQWKSLIPHLPVDISMSKAVSMFLHVSQRVDRKQSFHQKSPQALVSLSEQDLLGIEEIKDILIAEFYQLCDQLRSSSNLNRETPIRQCKQAWLALLKASILAQGVDSKPVEEKDETDPWSCRRACDALDDAIHVFAQSFDRISPSKRLEMRVLFLENLTYLKTVFKSIDITELGLLIEANFIERIFMSSKWIAVVQTLSVCQTIMFCIVAFDDILERDDTEQVIVPLNLCFLVVYLCDSIAKFFILRMEFLKSLWNRLDLLILTISLFGNIGWFLPGARNAIGKNALLAMSSGIVFRCVRVAADLVGGSRRDLARWENLKKMCFFSFRIALIMFWLLVVIFYVYAVLGMELFSCTGLELGSADPENVTSFNSFPKSLLLLFQVATTNDWNHLMYETVRATSLWASIFFISFYVLNVLVVLNLFSALVVEVLVSTSTDEYDEAERYLENRNTFELYTRFLA